MKTFNINTTAYQEEDLIITTDLTEDDIFEVILPLINAERDGYEEYDNGILISALRKRYPNNIIIDNTSKILITI